MRDLFANINNNYIYAGDKTSASPVREMSRQCSEQEAKAYDRLEKKIRELKKQRRN